jgi:hypothetical protein
MNPRSPHEGRGTVQTIARALLVGLTVLGIAACHSAGTGRAPLEAVAPVPAPSPAAPIASFGPTGTADTLAQIRVIFSDDLIPLEALDLVVDPKNRELRVNPESPESPLLDLLRVA